MVLLSESHLNEQAAGQNLFSLCCRLPSQTNPLAGMRGREGQLRHGSGCIHNHFLTPEEVKIIVIYFTCKLKTSLVNLSCNATEFLRAKTFFPCLCFPHVIFIFLYYYIFYIFILARPCSKKRSFDLKDSCLVKAKNK